MPDFELIPAVDVLNGRCVRLSQGRYDEATEYDADPGAVAERFASYGIRRLHVVDLDGAREGRPHNGRAIRSIVDRTGSLPVQLGGGIRNLASIEEAFEFGVDRVILGTAALRDPPLVLEGAARFPGRIVVGIDARDGRVAVQGWLESSDVRVTEVAKRFEQAGVAAIVYTDIARDGMLSGPNLEASAELAKSVSLPVIVSGGVSSEEDVSKCAAAAVDGIAGVIVGRALYTGAVQLDRALEQIACS